MTTLDIIKSRLLNQHIAEAQFGKPPDVVQWLGAVQAQDYAAAKWAVGLRLQSVTDDDIEQACTDGTILRTHVLRPTWHFVLPADIRWLLTLTAPRVNVMNATWYRKFELDDALFRSSNAVLIKALQDGTQLTRAELASLLQQAGIATDDLQRLSFIIMRAELDGIVCSGARRDKQFTYALLDERVPPQVRNLDHSEALTELALRYFRSRGPATIQDFVWWSGLTVADAKTSLEMVKSQLVYEVIDGHTYWCAPSALPTKNVAQTAYLLPNYDEYIVGYKDRSAIFDPLHTNKLDFRGNVLFNHTIVVNGRVVGTWKRSLKKDTVIITPSFFTLQNEAEMYAFVTSAQRHSEFLAMYVDVNLSGA